MDESADRRRVFLRLTERERFETLFDMLSYSNSERVKLDARVVELENWNHHLQGELDGISHRRIDTPQMTTEDRIKVAISQQFKGWQFYLSTFLIPSLQLMHTALFIALIGGLLWLVMQGHKFP